MKRWPLPPLPGEMTPDQRIAALESERVILKPYASSKGFPLLRARLREIERALYQIRGLPIE